MTRRRLYWIGGALLLVFQAGYVFSIYTSRSTLALVCMNGTGVLGYAALADSLIIAWPPKNTLRHRVYSLGSLLFVVLQLNFFVSLFTSPLSALYWASFIGTFVLMAAYGVDLIVQNWSRIWAVIKKFRRPPID